MKVGQNTGSLRPIGASCRDNVIAVDSLVPTHMTKARKGGGGGGEW